MMAEDAQPFLDRLPPADRSALIAAARRTEVPAGAEIIAEGEPAEAVFLLLEGEAVAVRYSSEGRTVSYSDIVAGDLFGEIAALDGGLRTAAVLARSRCVVGVLSSRDFEAAIAASPTLAMALMRNLARLVRLNSARVFEGVTMTVRQRLALELLRRAAPSEAGGGEMLIDPAPTHADLAARIGTHREAITKELSALAARKLLRRDGRRFVLPSADGLAAEIED
jgi:CRP-like cAMP-binding protein